MLTCNKTKYFLTTKNYTTWQKPLYDAIIHYISINYNDRVTCVPFRPKKYLKEFFFSIKAISNFFKCFIVILLYLIHPSKSVAQAKIDLIDVGRYVTASVMRNPQAIISKKTRLIRTLILGLKGSYFYACSESFFINIDYAYLHDTPYLMGIVNDVLIKKGIIVFVKGYPFTLIDCEGKCNNQLSPFFIRLDRPFYSPYKAQSYIYNRLQNPQKEIGYFQVEEKEEIDLNYMLNTKKNLAIVYAHSFTDAQLVYGYDGFNSVYDWLNFTIKMLLKEKYHIVIKGHPNFWAPEHKSNVVKWDKMIWRTFVNHNLQKENIDIIDFPIYNGTLLSKLQKDKTVIVSHHGNAIIECAALGFKTISSICSLWSNNYTFGEIWSDKSEYTKILSKNLYEYYVNTGEAFRFIHDMYLNPYGYHGNYYWRRIIAPYLGVTEKDLERRPELIDYNKINDYKIVIDKISKGITPVSKLIAN
jgi:hypothetical protein